MAILFAVVARGTTILSQYATCMGNFQEVVQQVLAKIPPQSAKFTYSHSSYLFHYISDSGIIYLCIADDDFERSTAFVFLQEIKKRFETQYGQRAHTALAYAMNSEFGRVLAAQMRHYNMQSSDVITSEEANNTVGKVQNQVDELKDIMVKNIDSIASRGEKLELLVDKTEDLSNNSVSFRKTSRNLARSMWWKNVKLTIIIVTIAVIVVILIIYFIVSGACGGLDWKKCVKHN